MSRDLSYPTSGASLMASVYPTDDANGRLGWAAQRHDGDTDDEYAVAVYRAALAELLFECRHANVYHDQAPADWPTKIAEEAAADALTVEQLGDAFKWAEHAAAQRHP